MPPVPSGELSSATRILQPSERQIEQRRDDYWQIGRLVIGGQHDLSPPPTATALACPQRALWLYSAQGQPSSSPPDFLQLICYLER